MKKLLSIFLLAGLATGLWGVWQFSQGHEPLKNEKAEFELSAQELLGSFTQDEGHATRKYLNKVVRVEGQLTEIQHLPNSHVIVVLGETDNGFGISCALSKDQASKTKRLHIGSSVVVIGLCTGYLMDVNLVRCVII